MKTIREHGYHYGAPAFHMRAERETHRYFEQLAEWTHDAGPSRALVSLSVAGRLDRGLVNRLTRIVGAPEPRFAAWARDTPFLLPVMDRLETYVFHPLFASRLRTLLRAEDTAVRAGARGAAGGRDGSLPRRGDPDPTGAAGAALLARGSRQPTNCNCPGHRRGNRQAPLQKPLPEA
nr:hypothetical protein [Paenibacillus sabuli]